MPSRNSAPRGGGDFSTAGEWTGEWAGAAAPGFDGGGGLLVRDAIDETCLREKYAAVEMAATESPKASNENIIASHVVTLIENVLYRFMRSTLSGPITSP